MTTEFHSGDKLALILKDMGVNQNEAAAKFKVQQGTINSWLSKQRFSPLILSRHFEKKLPALGYNPKFLVMPGQPMKLEDVGQAPDAIRVKIFSEINDLSERLDSLKLLVAQL